MRVCVCWWKTIDSRFRIKVFEFRVADRSLIRLYERDRHRLFWCSRIQKKKKESMSLIEFKYSSLSFYLNLLCYSRLLETLWDLSLLLLLSHQNDRSYCPHDWAILCSELDVNHRRMQKNDQNREIYDSKEVCRHHD